MNQSALALSLATLKDLSYTGVLFYLVYSLRVYLMARLDKHGAEPWIVERRSQSEAQSEVTQ